MKIDDRYMLKKFNFSDFEVVSMTFNTSSHEIDFIISRGLSLIQGEKYELAKGFFRILGYESIFITSYNAINDIEKVVYEEKCDLNEISEMDIYENKIIIKGFAKQGGDWIELEVVGGVVDGEFPINKRLVW